MRRRCSMPTTMERYANICVSMLAAMVADDTQSVDRIALLSERERAAGAGGVERDARRSIRPTAASTSCSRSRSSVRRTRWRWCTKTSTELRGAQRASEPAGALSTEARRGPERGWRCAWSAAGDGGRVAGDLKAGGAYVPLDPAYPPERLGTCWRTASRWWC